MIWQTLDVPLIGGLDTGADPRALDAPALLRCQNVRFDDRGGLRKRFPYAALAADLPAATRRVVAFQHEILAFTATRLHSWSPALGGWQDRGEYLAPKVEQAPRFVSATEQVAADRAEVAGVAAFVWTEDGDAFIAAMDVASGAVLLSRHALDQSGTALPRIVALDEAFHVFAQDGSGEIYCLVIPVADIGAPSGWTEVTVSNAGTNGPYDVAVADNVSYVAWQHTVTTSYGLASVDDTGTVSRQLVAQTCDGVIAIAARGDAPNRDVMVVRVASTNVRGDLFDNSLTATAHVDLAVGTVAADDDQITCAFRSTPDSGEHRCYAFWSSGEIDDDTAFPLKSNYADSGGAVGTQGTFLLRSGIASHAFDHNGQVYLWVVFAAVSASAGMDEPLGLRAAQQNQYLLYRDDGVLVAKTLGGGPDAGAGGLTQTDGLLPGVQSLGDNRYAWAGLQRRLIPEGGNDVAGTDLVDVGYAARSPVEIVVTFDSNDARRAAVLGSTLYLSGGQIMQYDGTNLVELGFHVAPWYFAAVDGGAGALSAGRRIYQCTAAWENTGGELDRCSAATTGSLTVTASKQASLAIAQLHHTLKTGVVCEVWRSIANPPTPTAFYLNTDRDPTNTSGDNRYMTFDATAGFLTTYVDDLVDDAQRALPTHPENSGQLPTTAPPPATIVVAGQDRLFLAGVAGHPCRVVYSKLRNQGEVAAFYEGLYVDLPPHGGAITALAILDGTLIVFQERAVFSLPGTGFDNLGGGQNFGPPEQLSVDVGADSQETVCVSPAGIVFHGAKGWHMLDRGRTLRYIGHQVEGFDGDAWLAVHVVGDTHEIRAVSANRVLVFNTKVEQWSEWTVTDAAGACTVAGVHHIARGTSVLEALRTYTGVDYSIVVKTAPVKIQGQQGMGRVRRVLVLGEYRSAHTLQIDLFRDDAQAAFQSKVWTPPSSTAGDTFQVKHGPSARKMRSLSVQLTDLAADGVSAAEGEGLALTGIALEVGVMGGLRRLPRAQKQ